MAEQLTPYATAFRYPETSGEPEQNEVVEAASLTHAFIAFVYRLLAENKSEV
jgi:hypothetical protein